MPLVARKPNETTDDYCKRIGVTRNRSTLKQKQLDAIEAKKSEVENQTVPDVADSGDPQVEE